MSQQLVKVTSTTLFTLMTNLRIRSAITSLDYNTLEQQDVVLNELETIPQAPSNFKIIGRKMGTLS
jgi:hypothetical protein